MLEMYKEWFDARHEYAKEWKEKSGGKVMGYFCTYAPEEIMYAAGILPVRILGSHEPQDVTEPHIFAMFCPFCRDCLAQGLKGRYDYLDGIMISQSCLHIRQAFTSWKMHIPTQYSYYLPMPMKVQSPRALPYLRAELENFKKSLEEWTGNKITDDDLRNGIELMNENRRLMHQVYEMRKKDNPPITGLDSMYMVVSSQMTHKQEHSRITRDVINELGKKENGRKTGERLMIIGSEDDDSKFIQMCESVGATFVIDDHCTGSRYFWNEVEPNGDPLTAIAKRYIERPPCPSKDWEERRRIPHILQLAADWKVKGAVLIQQKFCDPHELDTPVTVPIGQFRTRVEALLEMLQEEDLF
jgi:benzoyl-CoA reductase subunit C